MPAHPVRPAAGEALLAPPGVPDGAGVTRRTALALGIAFCSAACKTSTRAQRDPREAIQAAHDFVKVRLVSPGQAAFGGEADTQAEEIGPNKFRVNGMVDYTVTDGSTMRVRFTCVVSFGNNGQWSLDEMDFH